MSRVKKPPRTRRQPTSLLRQSFRDLMQIRAASISFWVLVAMLFLAFVGPWIIPYTGSEINLRIAEHEPTLDHPLGTDEYGRDVLVRLLLAGRISLTIGLASMVLSLVLGAILGIVAGYFRGWVDAVIMRVADVLLSIPSIPLLIVMAAIMSELRVAPEQRIWVVMGMLSVIGWPGLARLIRGQVLSLREQTYMRATDVLGLPTRSKLFKHLLPNVLPLLIVVATLSTASGILQESALSFLGLGVQAPTASWGNMIAAANNLIDFQEHWWLWLPPGIALLITIAAINVFGDRLRDVMDPKTRRMS